MKFQNYIFFLIAGLIHMTSVQLSATPSSRIPIITVWVHGTKSSEFLTSRLNMDTLFSCKKGLHKASSLKKNENFYCIAKELSEVNPKQFPWEHFHTFGWSGKLKHAERQNAAKKLYLALTDLVASYRKKYDTKPLINIITHSHGGNVSLNMANFVDQEYLFKINKLILLACPVQNYTIDLIKSPLFKKIYSIHSHTDTLQILDPQGLHPFFDLKHLAEFKRAFITSIKTPLFSQRHFPINPKMVHTCIRWTKGVPWEKPFMHDSDYLYPKSIKVALQHIDKVKSNRGLLHVEFTLLPFITHLPQVIDQLDIVMNKTAHCISNSNPDTVIQL